MNAKQILILGASVLASSLCGRAIAQETQGQYVQVAQIEIDPDQLDAYRAAVKEQIETAIRVEPGVLVLYAVSEKDNPTHVTVFEIYSDTDAYRSHLESAHFTKYKKYNRENGQVAQACPNDPHYARCETEMRARCRASPALMTLFHKSMR